MFIALLIPMATRQSRHCEEPFKNAYRIVNPNGDAAISYIETRNTRERLPRRDSFGTITTPFMRLAMTYESGAISPGLRLCEEPF